MRARLSGSFSKSEDETGEPAIRRTENEIIELSFAGSPFPARRLHFRLSLFQLDRFTNAQLKALEQRGNALWVNLERVSFGKGLQGLWRGAP